MRIRIPERIIKGRSVGIIFSNQRFSPARERENAFSLSRSMDRVRAVKRLRSSGFFIFRSSRFIMRASAFF